MTMELKLNNDFPRHSSIAKKNRTRKASSFFLADPDGISIFHLAFLLTFKEAASHCFLWARLSLATQVPLRVTEFTFVLLNR